LIPRCALPAAKTCRGRSRLLRSRRERFRSRWAMTAWRALPGQRQSVKAAAAKRWRVSATALRDWRWSGLFAASGLARYLDKYGWMALGSL